MDNYQTLLFPYAYNILGCAEEARDAIQDVITKYLQNKKKPDNEKNYLIKSVINQSINRKRDKQRLESESALPQPITTSYTDVSTEMKDLVSYSLLILLEKLNPKERAVFILKEAFAYTHKEIADVLSISLENARKLLSRAITKIQKPDNVRKHQKPTIEFNKLEELTEAIKSRNLVKLHELFHEDIVFRADGGKRIQVVTKYLQGIEEVSSLVMYVYHRFQSNYSYRFTIINHQAALLYYDEEGLKVCQVFTFDKECGQIKELNVILDPDKLALINFG